MNRPPQAHNVGYSIVRTGQADDLEVCLVVPHVAMIARCVFDPVRRTIRIESDRTHVTLQDVPEDVVRIVARAPDRALIVTTDTFATVRCAVAAASCLSTRMAERASSSASGAAAVSMFNDFMTRAAKRGHAEVLHLRLRTRQAETEAFLLKAFTAVSQLAKVAVTFEMLEMPTSRGKSCRLGLADAVQQLFEAEPSLAVYLGEPPQELSVPGPKALSDGELFTALHSYAHGQLALAAQLPAFATSAVTLGAGMSMQTENMRQRVRDAADSVFAQSFADVYALTLRAAFDGVTTALDSLTEVTRRRRGSGDFTTFSLAPLSHDTSDSLELLRVLLDRKFDFSLMTRQQLWNHSVWIASSGTGAWLQRHGTSQKAVAAIVNGIETSANIVADAALLVAAAGH